jgi:RNA polymerase sigma-32 factor
LTPKIPESSPNDPTPETSEADDWTEEGNGGDDSENRPALPTLRKKSKTSAANRDLLQAYLSEIRKHPLLSTEEERELAIRYNEEDDREAAERLVTANLRLVVKLAFQYHRQWANVLDLVQEGNVGLVHALSRYDPYRGIRFSSYAQYWIRAMILRFLMDNYRMVRLGSTRAGRQLFFQLQKERERLVREGLRPTTKLLAERLEVSEREVIAVDQHLRAPAASLHAPLGGEDSGRALADIVPDDGSSDPEDQVSRLQMGAVIGEQLTAFRESLTDEREQIIWDDRLVSPDPQSLSALGKRFGVSKERVRQLEVRIRHRLKVLLEETIGDEIDFEFDLSGDS